MNEIRKKLEAVIREVFGVEISAEVVLAPELDEETEVSPDFATNVAMKLSGELRKRGKAANPREVAEKIKGELEKDEFFEGFKIEIAGPGFLNFTPSDEFYFKNIRDFGVKFENFEKDISLDEYSGKTVVCEFSDPNPFKVLHVGHLYTSIVGDSISRLIENAGGKVVRANFGGDVGLHVAKTIYAIELTSSASSASADALLARRMSNTSRSATPASLNKLDAESFSFDNKNDLKSLTIEDIAGAYVKGTRAYEDDAEAKQKIVQLNKLIYKIAEAGEGKFEGENDEEKRVAEIYWRGRELSYKYFEDFYKKIGVKFDKYYPESTVAKVGLNKILEQEKQGVYEESDGAVVFRGEKFGLHTRVFVNKEGLPTYEAKDVGLLFTKWADWKFDESVVITGNDITEYMKVVLKSVEQYAPELVEKTKHITHGNVRLPGNEKMSSRKGNFVKAVEILEMVKDKAARLRSEDSFREPAPARATSARQAAQAKSLVSQKEPSNPLVGAQSDFDKTVLGAIKYFFLKYKIGGNIVFDAEESVSLNGNSGPYLQYSAVRGKKILLAVASSSADALLDEGGSLNLFERRLNKKFVQYPEVLRNATREKAPHLVANYLFELAQEFSRFYENCKVIGDENEAQRIKFVQVFDKIMEHGLGILGISVPEEM